MTLLLHVLDEVPGKICVALTLELHLDIFVGSTPQQVFVELVHEFFCQLDIILLSKLDSLLGVSQDFIFHLQALDEKAIMDNCPRRVAVLLKCLDDNAYDLTFLVLCQKRQRRSQP